MRKSYWTYTIDNITYNIEFTKSFFKKKLLVNSLPIKIGSSKTFCITRETAFNLGMKTAILVTIDKESDLAVDGIFLNSGKRYKSVKYIPIWNYIFLGLVLIIYIFNYDSLCVALFTLSGLYFLIRTSIEPSLNIIQRIFLCLIITFSMHLFFWNVLYILLSIL